MEEAAAEVRLGEEEEDRVSAAPPLTAQTGRPCAPAGATVRLGPSQMGSPRPDSAAPPPTARPGPPPAPSGATARGAAGRGLQEDRREANGKVL